jgi:hypothetical protein
MSNKNISTLINSLNEQYKYIFTLRHPLNNQQNNISL